MLKIVRIYHNYEALYERKKRAYCINPDHRGRSTFIMSTFAIYHKSAEEENDKNFRRFLRLPLAQFDELLAKVVPRVAHAKTHSDLISAETRLVLTLRLVEIYFSVYSDWPCTIIHVQIDLLRERCVLEMLIGSFSKKFDTWDIIFWPGQLSLGVARGSETQIIFEEGYGTRSFQFRQLSLGVARVL